MLHVLFAAGDDEDSLRAAILEQVPSRTFGDTIEALVVAEVGTLLSDRAQQRASLATRSPEDRELQELYEGWYARRERALTVVFTTILTNYEIGSQRPNAAVGEELARVFGALLEGGAVVRVVDEDLAERAGVTLIRQQLQAAMARVVGRRWPELAGLRAST